MKLGFIGSGNMATAIIGGIIEKKVVEAGDIFASDKMEAAVQRAEAELGIHGTTCNLEVVQQADVLFLAVKPQFLEGVLEEIRGTIKPHQIIVSIVVGKTLTWLKERLGKEMKIVRTMPNTPALVGEGITGVCPSETVTAEEEELVLKLLHSFGRAEIVSEKVLDVVGAVSGSSPAFVFMMIEAMADGAVAEGMPRKSAYEFAAQSVLGSAKMVLETGKHPGELKDMVCSPGGTTIEGVGILEEKGMRSAFMDCIRACVKKTREL